MQSEPIQPLTRTFGDTAKPAPRLPDNTSTHHFVDLNKMVASRILDHFSSVTQMVPELELAS